MPPHMGHREKGIFFKPIPVPWSCKLPSGQRRLQNNWEESGRRGRRGATEVRAAFLYMQ